jgi:hypothetical protein
MARLHLQPTQTRLKCQKRKPVHKAPAFASKHRKAFAMGFTSGGH